MQNCIANIIKKHGSWLSVSAVTLLIAAVFYYMNAMTPLYADDYCYSVSFATLERIESASQIPGSMLNHYYTTNGRILLHTLAQLFLLWGKDCFNVLNTVAFLLLLFVIYYHVYGSWRPVSAGKLAVIAMLLFVSVPAFGQSYLWVTGASNYLYGILLVLLALLPWRKQANGSRAMGVPMEILAALGGLVLGFLAGWTNENTAVAMVAMMLAFLLFYRCRGIRIHGWNFTALAGAVAGCACMLLAPGNAARLETVGEEGGLVTWILRAVNYTYSLFTYLHVLVLLFALLLCLYILQNRQKIETITAKNLLTLAAPSALAWIYFLGFLGAVYSMVAAPGFPPRAWSGPTVLALIMVGNLSTAVDLSGRDWKVVKTGVVLFLLVFSLCTFENAQYELENILSASEQRQQLLETAKQEGRTSVAIPAIRTHGSPYSCFTIYDDIQSDSSYWLNEAIARYYGFEEITRS